MTSDPRDSLVLEEDVEDVGLGLQALRVLQHPDQRPVVHAAVGVSGDAAARRGRRLRSLEVTGGRVILIKQTFINTALKNAPEGPAAPRSPAG